MKDIGHLASTIIHKSKGNYDVYIGRPSKWGNPFTHIKDKETKAEFIVSTRKESIERYYEWITTGDGKYLLDDLHELKDKTMGCWCKPKACHGDILVELVNKKFPDIIDIW